MSRLGDLVLSAGLGALLLLASCSPAAPSDPAPTAAPVPESAGPTPTPSQPVGDDRGGFSRVGWKTDFARSTVPLSEIASGGPPRDGIPPIDAPRFVSASEAGIWLKDQEPVIALGQGGDARAYPLQILIWHEIVNDTVGGTPVAVTFCPLCNTAIVFDRRVAGRTLTFGTT